MKPSYAVVWSSDEEIRSGRLEPLPDRLVLSARDDRFSIMFSDVVSASIARRRVDRLRGLPVLVLRRRSDAPIRIASLEGAGVLHEFAQHVERAGFTLAV